MKKRAIIFGWAMGLSFGIAMAFGGDARAANADRPVVLAQAMVPPTGMNDADKPMPMDERMSRRFPQPVRVGDLIGLPVLNNNDLTLGFVRQVVRTPAGRINLIVSYSKWFGWFGRPIAVPVEVVAIDGRELVAIDMSPNEFAAAPTWQGNNATVLSNDVSIRVALGRH